MRLLALASWLGILPQAPPVDRAVDVAREVVILVNDDHPGSAEVGEYYAARRGIPASQICHIQAAGMADNELCTWYVLRYYILLPLQNFLATRPEVLYVVPTFGVPLQALGDVEDSLGVAVDREIELLKVPHALGMWVTSATFGLDRRLTTADGIYIVSRLDGATAADAKSLVDSALAGEAHGVGGRSVVDSGGSSDKPLPGREEEARTVSGLMAARGLDCETLELVDANLEFDTRPDLAHYYGLYASWMPRDPDPGWRFQPGAVGAHFGSITVASIRQSDPWIGYGAAMVHHGIAGTWGCRVEPYEPGVPRADVFFERFLRGHTFGESLQMANELTSWMAIFIGDPLYAPYARNIVEDQAPPSDPGSGGGGGGGGCVVPSPGTKGLGILGLSALFCGLAGPARRPR